MIHVIRPFVVITLGFVHQVKLAVVKCYVRIYPVAVRGLHYTPHILRYTFVMVHDIPQGQAEVIVEEEPVVLYDVVIRAFDTHAVDAVTVSGIVRELIRSRIVNIYAVCIVHIELVVFYIIVLGSVN